jgi:hypothetical protein
MVMLKRGLGIAFMVFCLGATGLAAAGETPDLDEETGGIICYRENAGFLIPVPEGWNVDEKNGRQAGACAFLYRQEETFDTASTLFFAQILPTPQGADPVDTLVKYSLERMLQMSPKARTTVKEGPEIRGAQNRAEPDSQPVTFQTRYFDDIPVPYGFQLVAYAVSEEATLLLVLSSETEKGRAADEPLLRSVAQRVVPMQVSLHMNETGKESPAKD